MGSDSEEASVMGWCTYIVVLVYVYINRYYHNYKSREVQSKQASEVMIVVEEEGGRPRDLRK